MSVCDDCELEPGSCDHDTDECVRADAEQAAADDYEARREAYE